MNISIIGTGWVGLVQSVIFAEHGMHVICMDVNETKINQLRQGILPIYEPGLEELFKKNINTGRLLFTTNIQKAITDSSVIFITVGTSTRKKSVTNIKCILSVANSIGEYINDYKVIVDKSTVPVGTSKLVKQIILDKLKSRNSSLTFDMVSNPEFLSEGEAIQNCLRPDRVVLGTETNKALEIMKNVYYTLHNLQVPFVTTNIETAEMIKYTANAFLAVKLSFINEISAVAEKVGANTIEIAKGIGLDKRIGCAFFTMWSWLWWIVFSKRYTDNH